MKTGFKLNSRIIRPAKVGVIKKPAATTASTAASTETK